MSSFDALLNFHPDKITVSREQIEACFRLWKSQWQSGECIQESDFTSMSPDEYAIEATNHFLDCIKEIQHGV